MLEPNVNSDWFLQNLGRQHDHEILSIESVNVSTIDEITRERRLDLHFLKIDVEGMEYQVLKGAEETLAKVLGMRVEVSFEEVFKGSRRFWEVAEYLNFQEFKLMNLDYIGRGLPKSYFCPSESRFGIISSSDAIFLRKNYEELTDHQRASIVLFCFQNSLEDVAVYLLSDRKLNFPSLGKLGDFIEMRFLEGSNKLLYLPNESFLQAKADYEEIFQREFPDKGKFWPYIHSLNEKIFAT